MHLNPLLEELNSSGLVLNYGSSADDSIAALAYADDLVLVASSAEKLQMLVNILKNFCDKWRLNVNTGKTKVVVFRCHARCRATSVEIYYGDAILSRSPHTDTLVLCWMKHFEGLGAAVSKALGSVLSWAVGDVGYMTFNEISDHASSAFWTMGLKLLDWSQTNALMMSRIEPPGGYLGVHRSCPPECFLARQSLQKKHVHAALQQQAD